MSNKFYEQSVFHWPVTVSVCIEMDPNGVSTESSAPEIEFDLFRAFTKPPQWLTKDYIEQVLRDSEKDQLLKVSL